MYTQQKNSKLETMWRVSNTIDEAALQKELGGGEAYTIRLFQRRT